MSGLFLTTIYGLGVAVTFTALVLITRQEENATTTSEGAAMLVLSLIWPAPIVLVVTRPVLSIGRMSLRTAGSKVAALANGGVSGDG